MLRELQIREWFGSLRMISGEQRGAGRAGGSSKHSLLIAGVSRSTSMIVQQREAFGAGFDLMPGLGRVLLCINLCNFRNKLCLACL